MNKFEIKMYYLQMNMMELAVAGMLHEESSIFEEPARLSESVLLIMRYLACEYSEDISAEDISGMPTFKFYTAADRRKFIKLCFIQDNQ